jgi:hypothetical protein
MTGSHATKIARLRVTLDDIEPKIWRLLEVPLSSSLRGVHDAIQAVMLFEDRHLFMFEQGNGDQRKRYGLPNQFQDSYFQLYNARSTKLGALVDRGIDRLTYTYDFGDDWRHTIEVEAVEPADPATQYPRFVEGAGAAPPEDVGGLPGFENFLKAMTDAKHRERAALVNWYDGIFNPIEIREAEINSRMAKLAKRRERGKLAHAKSLGQG